MTLKQIYVAGPNGFTDAGRAWHTDVVLPTLVKNGLEALDPWSGPAEQWFTDAFAVEDFDARVAAVAEVNQRVGLANAQMIDACDAVLANLEGVDVDSGTAAEIGYACAKGRPIVAFRPDLRTSGDNIASIVNLQVEYFIRASGGAICDSLAEAVAALKEY